MGSVSTGTPRKSGYPRWHKPPPRSDAEKNQIRAAVLKGMMCLPRVESVRKGPKKIFYDGKYHAPNTRPWL